MSNKINSEERQALIKLSEEYKKYKDALNMAMETV